MRRKLLVGKTATRKDLRQALLDGEFINHSQADEIGKRAEASGRTFEEEVVEMKYVSEATLGTVQRFLRNANMSEEECANLVTVNPAASVAKKEVTALVVKNLVTAAKGLAEIYLVPTAEGTEVFFRKPGEGVLSLFATLPNSSLVELIAGFKEMGGIEIREAAKIKIK